MGKLEGKVAVITGGTTGIGRATAELSHAEGTTVVVTGTNELNLKRAREEVGPGAVACDSASVADLDALVEHVRAAHGRIDVLFVNAGLGGGRTDRADRRGGVRPRGRDQPARLAAELLPRRIRVDILTSGATDTALLSKA